MPVGTDTAEEEVDTTSGEDRFLVGSALGLEVGGITIEDVYVLLLDVDVAEEVLPHKGVVALGMILGDTYVLIHVEGDDVLEGYTPGLMSSHQGTIHAEGRGACGQTKYEGLSSRRSGSIDLLDYIVRCPLGDAHIVGLDD